MAFDFKNGPERALYQGFLTEAGNIFGIDIEYWRVDRDATEDTLYQEDPYPNISSKFPMKALIEGDGKLWKEIYQFGKYGFQSPDALDIYITRQQWLDAYQIEESTPKAGDFVSIRYMGEDITTGITHGRVFIVTTVEQEDFIFHQQKQEFRLHLVAADTEGTSINPAISASDDPDDQLADPLQPNYDPELNDDSATNTPEITGSVLRNKPGDPSPFGDW